MEWRAPAHPLWEHTCCQTRRWSAARRCDRCGAPAGLIVLGVSIADAMGRLHSLEHLLPRATSEPAVDAAAVLDPDEQAHSAGHPSSGGSPRLSHPRSACHGGEDESVAPAPAADLHPARERALVFALWLLAALVSTFMVIGAVVEFERANYIRSFTCAISAAAPAGAIAFSIGRWLEHCRARIPKA